MKKLLLYLAVMCCFSCTEVLYVSVEQMLPPEIMPKHTVRSVGVVSNFSQNNVVVANENAIVLPCDADSVKEQVALSFADAGIMDRVVVLDSLLYHPDSTHRHILSQEEVNTLCQELEVEMIYSIDYACLIYNPAARFISRPLNAYLCSRIYIPQRDSIMGASMMDKETLDYWIDSSDEVGYYISRVPQLLAESAVGPYLPSWKERERVFYYDRLCYALREAKVYVSEDNWEAAYTQWQSLAESRHRLYRFMGYYNMALYYEMNDNIDQALRSLDMAKETATKKNKKGDTFLVIDTTLVNEYYDVLEVRKKEIAQLEEYRTREN